MRQLLFLSTVILLTQLPTVSSTQIDNYCDFGMPYDWPENWDPDEIWVDLVIILDNSEPMAGFLAEAKAIVESFVSMMSTDTSRQFYSRIGVVAGSDTAEVIYSLNMTNFNSLDAVKLKLGVQMNFQAAFQAALAMLQQGSIKPSYRANAKQIVLIFARSAPTGNTYAVDDFKSVGGIVIVNEFLKSNQIADPAWKEIASTNFFYTNLADNFMNSLQVLCEANCYCAANLHAFNDDDLNARTEANRGCFNPVNNGIPQAKARQTCQYSNANLVSIHDQQKEFFVYSVVSVFGTKKKYWLGLENNGTTWNWDDQSSNPYNDWEVNQPDTNDGQLLCAYAMQTTGLNVKWTAAN